MELNVEVGNSYSPLFTAEQLQSIASSLRVRFPEGVMLVFFGEKPPFDKTLRWQKVDAYGAPVGQIQIFNGTTWA